MEQFARIGYSSHPAKDRGSTQPSSNRKRRKRAGARDRGGCQRCAVGTATTGPKISVNAARSATSTSGIVTGRPRSTRLVTP